MTMSEETFWVIYFVGCFLACFPVTWATATQFGTEEPDTETILMGIAMSLCSVWIWPLMVFPGIPVYYAVKGWGK